MICLGGLYCVAGRIVFLVSASVDLAQVTDLDISSLQVGCEVFHQRATLTVFVAVIFVGSSDAEETFCWRISLLSGLGGFLSVDGRLVSGCVVVCWRASLWQAHRNLCRRLCHHVSCLFCRPSMSLQRIGRGRDPGLDPCLAPGLSYLVGRKCLLWSHPVDNFRLYLCIARLGGHLDHGKVCREEAGTAAVCCTSGYCMSKLHDRRTLP
jgi:hypothetical protein